MLKKQFEAYLKLRKEESKYIENEDLIKLKATIGGLSIAVFIFTFLSMNIDKTILVTFSLFTELFILITLYDRFLLLFCYFKQKRR